MSDYEVTLVNDNMQEFYVRFFGPAESALSVVLALLVLSQRIRFPPPRGPLYRGMATGHRKAWPSDDQWHDAVKYISG